MTATIQNCKTASIRKCPWRTRRSDEVIGSLKAGQTIEIDNTKTYYDWTGRAFYKCNTQFGIGYVAVGLVS